MSGTLKSSFQGVDWRLVVMLIFLFSFTVLMGFAGDETPSFPSFIHLLLHRTQFLMLPVSFLLFILFSHSFSLTKLKSGLPTLL